MAGSTEEEQFQQPTPDFVEAEAHHTGVDPATKLVDDPKGKPAK